MPLFPRLFGRMAMKVADMMTLGENASLDHAVELMERHHVKRLPVLKGDAMVGIK